MLNKVWTTKPLPLPASTEQKNNLSALRATEAHYRDHKFAATKAATETLRSVGFEITLTEYSRRAGEAVTDQWAGRKPTWDWGEIARRHRSPKSYCVAIWLGDRLAGLFLIELGTAAATVRYVEGDPRPDSPTKGKCALIAFEVATNYAQRCGLNELRIHPINDALATLYEGVYGFGLVKPAKEEPYYRKGI